MFFKKFEFFEENNFLRFLILLTLFQLFWNYSKFLIFFYYFPKKKWFLRSFMYLIWGFFCMFFFGFFSKLLRLLLKVTKVTIGHQTWPKMDQSSITSYFIAQRANKKASAKGWSPPQELKVSPRSRMYLLVNINKDIWKELKTGKKTQKNSLIDWRTGGQDQRTEGHNKREIKI